jgi:hypothetical protein
MRIFASGLRFPEGPIAMADGSLLIVEIERGTLTRVDPRGGLAVIAIAGAPNGAAISSGGRIFSCNSGSIGRRRASHPTTVTTRNSAGFATSWLAALLVCRISGEIRSTSCSYRPAGNLASALRPFPDDHTLSSEERAPAPRRTTSPLGCRVRHSRKWPRSPAPPGANDGPRVGSDPRRPHYALAPLFP